MITIPNNFISDIMALIGGVFGDLMPFLILIIGIFLGFFIAESVVGFLKPKNKIDEIEYIYDDDEA